MRFVPYILQNNNRVDVRIRKMTKRDADTTNAIPRWQTSWTSEYISDPKLEKYSVLYGNELVALGAYEVLESALMVHIVYMEAQPESNPTMDQGNPKYTGISDIRKSCATYFQ